MRSLAWFYRRCFHCLRVIDKGNTINTSRLVSLVVGIGWCYECVWIYLAQLSFMLVEHESKLTLVCSEFGLAQFLR